MNLLRIIRISRPIGYVVAPIVFLAQILLYNIEISSIILIQLALLTFPLCFLIFGINDIYDIETDKKNPRKGGVEGAILKEREIKTVQEIAALCAILLFIPILLRPDLLTLASTVLIIFLTYTYSAPPLRLKERPPFDSISNSLSIYVICLLALSYGPGIKGFQIEGYYLLLGIIGIHIFSTIVDYTPDKTNNIITFATKYGKQPAGFISFSIAVFILLFSDIQALQINIFIAILGLVSIISAIRPDEQLAARLSKIIFLSFFCCSIWYLISLI